VEPSLPTVANVPLVVEDQAPGRGDFRDPSLTLPPRWGYDRRAVSVTEVLRDMDGGPPAGGSYTASPRTSLEQGRG